MGRRSKTRRKRQSGVGVPSTASEAVYVGHRRPDLALLVLCALSLAVHMVDLNRPFLDPQAWRQADTAGVARNYYEEGYDFIHPRVDWRGDLPVRCRRRAA